MTEKNIILIEGGTYTEVKRALKEWMEVYADSLMSGFRFELYRNGKRKYIIRADARLDNMTFAYLVNYLTYPVDIDYKVTVSGYTKITDSEISPARSLGQEVELFIPGNDNEYDNVYAVTVENKVYKIPFAGRTAPADVIRRYKEPEIDLASLSLEEEIVTELTEPAPEKAATAENNAGLPRHYKWVLPCIVLLFVLTNLLQTNTRNFADIHAMIGFSICLWFFIDSVWLTSDKFYYYSLLLSLAILIYGAVVGVGAKERSILIAGGTSAPFLFLILQRPLRIGVKSIIKREPQFSNRPGSFIEFLYSMILFLVPAVLAFCFWGLVLEQ